MANLALRLIGVLAVALTLSACASSSIAAPSSTAAPTTPPTATARATVSPPATVPAPARFDEAAAAFVAALTAGDAVAIMLSLTPEALGQAMQMAQQSGGGPGDVDTARIVKAAHDADAGRATIELVAGDAVTYMSTTWVRGGDNAWRVASMALTPP